MGSDKETKNGGVPRFLKALRLRRNKKRAASMESLDCTVATTNSTAVGPHASASGSDRTVNSSVQGCNGPPCNYPPRDRSSSPIVIEEEDDGSLEENLKKDIALANRVAALHAQQRMFGEDHPDVLFSLQNLAFLHYRRGQYDEAQRIYEVQQARIERSHQQLQGEMRVPSEIQLRF